MKPWTRADTQEWITQLEHRLEDIDYYLKRTTDWCEEYGIDDDRLVFLCSFLTCIWVSSLRDEPISYTELMELLGVEEYEIEEDKIYELGEKFLDLDHNELLERAVEVFNNTDIDDDYE